MLGCSALADLALVKTNHGKSIKLKKCRQPKLLTKVTYRNYLRVITKLGIRKG
jgi:hypothetical protein